MTDGDASQKGRIMGFDVGRKRIGVSVTDRGGFMAHPLATIDVASKSAAMDKIIELIEHYRPLRIVVGKPLNMNGTAGPMAKKCERFADELSKATGVEVSMWDERLTTVWAEKSLIEQGMRRGRRRQVVDRVAAALLLQSYLDNQQGGR